MKLVIFFNDILVCSVPIILTFLVASNEIISAAKALGMNDYLIKPLNPNQIFISIKRVLENNKIVSENLKPKFTNVFSEISNSLVKFWNFTKNHHLALSQTIGIPCR